jgi:acyl transferase domain-containing protein/acyl carrier protein
MYTRNAALLDQADMFDAEFFGAPKAEAASMDPQYRLLLEVAWEAVESAGYAAPSLSGSQTAVFVGVMNHDYEHLQNLQRDFNQISGYSGVGTALSVAAGRLSYFLGLKGPSLALDTACSSSLVAIHLACQSLRNRESHLALAGGVNLILSPTTMVAACKAMMLSADGLCKTFDAAADGYGRGEGCGIVVLKRLSDAVRDHDRVLAVIRGSAVNQDGRSQGLTAPNGPAQQAVISAALADGHLRPEDVDYVEAHGTGTPLGDPIEVQALGTVYGGQHRKGAPLWVSSVKTNIGHLESASGVAGLIKLILALQHGTIPPHLNLRTVNPLIDLEKAGIAIPTAATPWPEHNGKRRIGAINSFGFSGTNAHVIVEEAPAPQRARSGGPERPWHALALSGKSAEALDAAAERYVQYLESESAGALGDVCYTANTGRTHFAHRLVAIASDREGLAEDLRQKGSRALVRGMAGRTPPKVAFLFSGQGSQYAGMGHALYETAPVFRQAIDRCAELLASALDAPLTAVLWGDASAQLNETRYTQPALFALEYALATLWQAWGIKPAAVMGHSVGEVVAACVAGVFSLEDGLKLIAARARLMDSTAPGAMVAVLAPAAAVQARLAADTGVVIAAENGPSNTVLAGPPAAVQAVVQELTQAGIETRALAVTRAFHSPSMQPILAPFAEAAREITYHPPQIPLISNLTGKPAGQEVCTPEYWARHILAPVKFADGMHALHAQGIGVYLEVGPGSALIGMGRRCLADNGEQWLGSLRQGREDWQQLLESLARLYVSGNAVNWAALDDGDVRERLPLPTYPFQRQRYWFSESKDIIAPPIQPSAQELLPFDPWLGHEVHSGSGEILFLQRYAATTPFLVQDHRLHDQIFLPAAAHVATAVTAADRLLGGGAYVLSELAFSEALQLRDDEQVLLQYGFVPGANDSYAWRALSRANNDTRSKEAWKAHANGHIAPAPSSAADDLSREALTAVIDRCGETLEREALYRRFADLGYSYGPTFRGIAQLWWNSTEAIARIAIDAAETATSTAPGVLDSCFQTSLFAALIPGAAGREYIYVPVGIDRMQVYGRAKAPLWCHCTLRESKASTAVADISRYTDAGELLARIDGLRARRVPNALLSGRSLRESWFYKAEWIRQPLAHSSEPGKTAAPYVIFADRRGVGEALASQLQNEGERCVLIHRAEERRQADSHYYINPGSRDDFTWILSELARRDSSAGTLVYLWGLDAAGAETIAAPALALEQRLVCGPVLHLIQALAEVEAPPQPDLWVITAGAQALGQEASVPGLTASSLWGLGRVFDFENQNTRMARVDLDPGLSDPEAQAAFLLAELRANSPETQVAYRSATRHVARLVHAESDDGQVPTPAAIRKNATYLISGGLGSLGLVCARWLVTQGARHLALLSRNQPNDVASAVLDDLRQFGARIEIVNADVADETALATALSSISASLPPLAGVIHAAGVLNDGLLSEQSWTDFASVMTPKVLGAWNLHRYTREEQLDFFVLFSSAASLIGSTGQGAYSAANAFLDMLAWHRRSQGLPAISINWGPWSTGMAESAAIRTRLARNGIKAISPELGEVLFERILAQRPTQIGALNIDWSLAAADPRLQTMPYFESLLDAQTTSSSGAADESQRQQLLAELRNAPADQRWALLVNHIRQEIAGLLQLASFEEVDPDTDLFDLGLDSITALDLRGKVHARLGILSPPTILFTHPTVNKLAEFFGAQLFASEQNAPLALEPADANGSS